MYKGIGLILALCFVLLGASCSTAPEDEISLDTCDESDLGETGWTGPGVNGDGELAMASGTYVVSMTAAIPYDTRADRRAFRRLVRDVVDDMERRDGYIAGNLGGSRWCRSNRTMTVWRDHESMMKFVLGDAHLEAMGQTNMILQEFKTVSMELEVHDGILPTWDEQRERLAEVRTLGGLK